MKLSQPIEFDHEDRQQIYEYVERNGRAGHDETQRAVLPNDRGGFRHHVAILKRNGYLETTADGDLQVAIEDAGEEEFTGEEFTFTIRPARQKDLTGIVGAIRQVAEQGTYIVAETVAQELDHQEALLRHNELESRMFFVATVNDEVVGWVHLHAPELEKLHHTAELTVGVVDEYRGRGLGSHLLSRGLEWAGKNGYEKLYQSVPATNDAAIDFLETHGWETEAVREDHYKIDDEYVDEVMMAVEL
ncbi:L-amino acid N-acyltransferase YncA [Natronoarchaeum philippinense]|uniref:L-amino acid N-acyltransferase YncA n=1 Tax=Natronoarchaeum philippinense TaxID=558529 RepID=A0A285NY28_NATPI|nr:GNAT family N-acetyltransferase [Natronoarchaeum philippinense]SNZ12786.1 L-amino acid N-acyltransferase YncA [Natronoarchaeum philippinense]